MKIDVVLAGVGGQGVLSLAAILAHAARADGHEVLLSEVHGMAQRGGSVLAHLRIRDELIHSALIPAGSADLLIATEPLEALRQVPRLAPDAEVVTSSEAFRNLPDYPDEHELAGRLASLPSVTTVAPARLAREESLRRPSNLAILGAACRFLPIRLDSLEAAIRWAYGTRGDQEVGLHLAAFRAGRERVACQVH